jgi:hypothetical protein
MAVAIALIARNILTKFDLKYMSRVLTVFLIAMMCNSTHNLLKNFEKSSSEFNIVKNYNFKSPNSNILFVSDKPTQQFLVMAMYGEFNLLTDGWEPELLSAINGTNFDVFYLNQNSAGELTSNKIGTFEIGTNMKLGGGIITAEDMQKIPGFRKS